MPDLLAISARELAPSHNSINARVGTPLHVEGKEQKRHRVPTRTSALLANG